MNVTAKQWEHGWELHIEGIGVTQVRTLAHAAEQAADLVETMTGTRPGVSSIDVTIDIADGLAERAAKARDLLHTAELANAKAAKESRAVVAALRRKGLSVTDTAAVMGVSRGRISQLSAKVSSKR